MAFAFILFYGPKRNVPRVFDQSGQNVGPPSILTLLGLAPMKVGDECTPLQYHAYNINVSALPYSNELTPCIW